MNELATKIGVKARTVADFVDALEQVQLLIRILDPTDRRATFIQLSEVADNIIENLSME